MIQCAECDETVASELAKRQARDETEGLFRRLRNSGLPLDYRTGARRQTDLPLIAGDAMTLCEMLGRSVRGLFLWGPAGSYKTSVAAAFLADQIRKGVEGRYVFVPDLFADIHASYRSDEAESRAAIVRRCTSAPCLVLDDLGKEKASEHAAGVIFEILDARYRKERNDGWLIVTSNFDLDALCDRFPTKEISDPIQRRLSELCVGVPMEAR